MPYRRQEFDGRHHHPRGAKTKNLQIFDYAQGTRIVAGADGRVTGVTYIKDRKENYFQPAKVVLLGVLHLRKFPVMRLSKSKAFPNGLANNHGQVGRHYFGHWGTAVGTMALFPFDINIWYGLPAQGATVDEFADDNYDHSGLGFIGGTTLHARTELHPVDGASNACVRTRCRLGESRLEAIRRAKCRAFRNGVHADPSTLPVRETFSTSIPGVRDPLGDPVCRITSGAKENEDALGPVRTEKDGRMVPGSGCN